MRTFIPQISKAINELNTQNGSLNLLFATNKLTTHEYSVTSLEKLSEIDALLSNMMQQVRQIAPLLHMGDTLVAMLDQFPVTHKAEQQQPETTVAAETHEKAPDLSQLMQSLAALGSATGLDLQQVMTGVGSLQNTLTAASTDATAAEAVQLAQYSSQFAQDVNELKQTVSEALSKLLGLYFGYLAYHEKYTSVEWKIELVHLTSGGVGEIQTPVETTMPSSYEKNDSALDECFKDPSGAELEAKVREFIQIIDTSISQFRQKMSALVEQEREKFNDIYQQDIDGIATLSAEKAMDKAAIECHQPKPAYSRYPTSYFSVNPETLTQYETDLQLYQNELSTVLSTLNTLVENEAAPSRDRIIARRLLAHLSESSSDLRIMLSTLKSQYASYQRQIEAADRTIRERESIGDYDAMVLSVAHAESQRAAIHFEGNVKKGSRAYIPDDLFPVFLDDLDKAREFLVARNLVDATIKTVIVKKDVVAAAIESTVADRETQEVVMRSAEVLLHKSSQDAHEAAMSEAQILSADTSLDAHEDVPSAAQVLVADTSPDIHEDVPSAAQALVTDTSPDIHEDVPSAAQTLVTDTSPDIHEDVPSAAQALVADTSPDVHEDVPSAAQVLVADTSPDVHEDVPSAAQALVADSSHATVTSRVNPLASGSEAPASVDSSCVVVTPDPEKDYNDALIRLQALRNRNKHLQTDKLLGQIIDHIIDLHTKEPINLLTKALNDTYDRLTNINMGKTIETYESSAKEMQGHPSTGLKILGGLMLALGIAVLVLGIVFFPVVATAAAAVVGTAAATAVTATTVGVASIGLFTASGIGFFAGSQTGLSSEMSQLNKEMGVDSGKLYMSA